MSEVNYIVCPFCKQEFVTEKESAEPEGICKYPTSNGPCKRGVSDPLNYCWQHQENE